MSVFFRARYRKELEFLRNLLNALPEHLSSTALAQLENVASITKFDLAKEWILHSSAKTRSLFAWPVMQDMVVAEFEISDKSGSIACQLEATQGRIVILKFKKRLPHMPAEVLSMKMRNDPSVDDSSTGEPEFQAWLRRNAIDATPKQLELLWEMAPTRQGDTAILPPSEWYTVEFNDSAYCLLGHRVDDESAFLLVQLGTEEFVEAVREDDDLVPTSDLSRLLRGG